MAAKQLGGLMKATRHEGMKAIRSIMNKKALGQYGTRALGKFKNQYWQNLTNTNFLKTLLPYCPSILLPSKAFTMAEILLSLTIIGVVATITLPSLTGNINERTWATQKKALYSRMSQAIAMMPALNGFGQYAGTWSADSVSTTTDTAAETFVTEGLAKVLKINNICDADHFQDCGISSTIKNLKGSKMDFPKKLSEMNSMFTSTFTTDAGTPYTNPQKTIDTKAVAFETQNGESIVVYYNPFCTADIEGTAWHYTQPKMCANFVYDLNGTKGPNTFGKDIGFITALYPTDSNVVAPEPLTINAKNGTATGMNWDNARAACERQDENSRLPNRDELTAMFYNKQFLGISSGDFWSGSVVSPSTAWHQNFDTGHRGVFDRSYSYYVRCVRR